MDTQEWMQEWMLVACGGLVILGLLLLASSMDVKKAHDRTLFCATLSQEIGIDPNDNSDFLEECYNSQ